MKFNGVGRLYLRPKNNGRDGKHPGLLGVLISGMIAFTEPSALDEYVGVVSPLADFPQEKLVNVRITVEVISVYDIDDEESVGHITRGRIDQIVTSKFYSDPLSFDGVSEREIK